MHTTQRWLLGVVTLAAIAIAAGVFVATRAVWTQAERVSVALVAPAAAREPTLEVDAIRAAGAEYWAVADSPSRNGRKPALVAEPEQDRELTPRRARDALAERSPGLVDEKVIPTPVDAGRLVHSDGGTHKATATVPADAGTDNPPEESRASEQAGVPCGTTACNPGEVCCNASCAICTEPGAYCDPDPCDMQYPMPGQLCGVQSCSAGSTCCCGTCIPPGGSCDPDDCRSTSGLELSVPCGAMTLCDAGEVCCDPTCGACVGRGESCDPDICN